MSKIKKMDTLGIIGIVNENKTKLEIVVFSIFEDKKVQWLGEMGSELGC